MAKAKRDFWEILIPVASNARVEFTIEHHHQWDDFVRKISGGLTILRTAKGQWIDEEDGALLSEKMIPVKLLCSEAEIDKIIQFTIKHYNQKAVLAYRVGDKVKLVRPGKK